MERPSGSLGWDLAVIVFALTVAAVFIACSGMKIIVHDRPDCEVRPDGCLGFPCGSLSPSGFCAGRAQIHEGVFRDVCEITVCFDGQALPHELCECECGEKGHASSCFKACKERRGFHEGPCAGG